MDMEKKNINLEYWSQRASGYSDVNRWELEGESRGKWRSVLSRLISAHYPDREPGSVKVLDIGAGPGFIAIILTELGYSVTAADMVPEMLDEARQNAGVLADAIDFRIDNAEALSLADSSFDVVISRNLTWNLPNPGSAYSEWHRVLKDGGMLLNFDANWYNYLFDDEKREAYESDRIKSEELGLDDQNVGDNFDVMEDIARGMPLSRERRPAWDIEVLTGLGMKVRTDEDIWREVWTQQEQINFSSTPMFLVQAVK
jgi:SAM-dependent methyltransferase